MADVFISYSKSDRSFALDLAGELRARGISVWIDQSGIGGAKNWGAEIVEAINACSTMLCLLSEHSVESEHVAREVHLASEKQKNILPVLLEKVDLPPKLEYPLAGLQRVLFTDRPAILHALQSLASTLAIEELPAAMLDENSIRVAVLPFDDLSPEHDNQWFADGMMDELIAALSQLDHVKVPSRSDVLHYRERRVKSREIARELGVRYLIEGAVRKAGERIRINATLTDTRQNGQLWGNQFNGTFEDVFEFQESVSKHIANALKLTLTPDQRHRMDDRGTQNAEAYELYLKGRHEQYYLTKESYLRALDYYEQAAALDPRFERAFIAIASVCCAYYREYSKEAQWLDRAEQALTKALGIAGETSGTLMISGMIEWLHGRPAAAIESLTRSGNLDSKNFNAFNILGAVYLEEENFPAAVNAFKKVVSVIENTQSYFNVLYAMHLAGAVSQRIVLAQRALTVFDRHLLREPRDRSAAVSRVWVLHWAAKDTEAKRTGLSILEGDDLDGRALLSLGILFEEMGEPQLFLTLIQKAIERGFRDIRELRSVEIARKYPAFEQEYQAILSGLEEIIAREGTEKAAARTTNN